MAAKPSPEPLQPYRKVQAAAERDMAAILESTAKAIQKRVGTLRQGIGGDVRKAQLNATLGAIRRLQRSMWTGVIDPRVARGVDDAEKAAETAIETMTRVAYVALPEGVADVLVAGLRASAESGLKSDAARRKRDLSERVYRQAALHEGKVEEVIRQGLIANLSAKELADSAYKYVSPTAPGGASYAAMRLARTEINNAFHERQLAGANRPGVQAVKWNLSGSHRVPDLCNVYASHGGSGEWKPGTVPDKPHPQCFCFLTYITQSPAEFKRALASGSFDDEIDRRTRENMARLGQPVGGVVPDKTVDVPDKSTKAARPVKPKVRKLNVLDRFQAIFAQDWQKVSNPDKRAGGLWAESFFGMHAVRTAMRNLRNGKDPLDGTDVRRGRFDVFRDHEDQDDETTKSLYSEDDFKQDVLNAAELWEYKLITARENSKRLYRGIRMDSSKLFKEGEEFSSDIASWTESKSWANVYASTIDASTGHIGDIEVIMVLVGPKHSVNIDPLLGAAQRGSKEHLARGIYRVVNVRGSKGRYTVEVEEIGRNNPPS